MADSRLVNFITCCRLCLSDSVDDLKSVFDESVDDRGLQQKISACLGVEITSDDKLSTMVCLQCIEKINNWQSYKLTCCENQNKLEQWINTSNPELSLSDMNIQIKEEPIDNDILTPEVVMNGEIPVKNEPMEEEYNELPPPLTPQADDMIDVELVTNSPSSLTTGTDEPGNAYDPKKCSFCGKLFSSSGNRKKHERKMHGPRKTHSVTQSDNGSLSQDEERSQSSVDSQPPSEPPPKEPTSEEKKILFAAGLKLLQRNSTPPIAFENLSKIENSYIEKCKAMVTMHNTLKCACHNVTHPNLKGLLSHLRSLRIWFPVFTCYHCMITFTDRSTGTKHYLRCPKSNLETLIKLSNLKKRSEVKTRLYQNYKCTICRFMYTFHEDFCTHVDEDHSHISLPYTCSCGRVFTSLEDYKDHAYISCLVEFYCDVCFVTVKTLDAFQKHAAEVHDNSEGFVLLQEDNYKRRKSSPGATQTRQSVKREHTDERNIISGKRRTSYKPPIIDPEDDEDTKVLNPLFKHKLGGTVCPICNKEYSTNNNMWRHYKTHVQDKKEEEFDDSIYCCPDCGGMFSTAEWEKHKGMHKKKTCKECGKIFQFQSELDQHRSVHLNLKLYRDSKTQNYKSTMASPTNELNNIVMMCEICDRMFTSKEQLKEHKLTHETMPVLESSVPTNGEENKTKKYRCKICDKQYAGYGGLWDHNRKKHPDHKSPQSHEFPKKCEYCDKIFYTGGSYFMHRQMHERNNQKKLEAPQLQPATNDEEPNEEDPEESYHTCKRCFKVFSNRCNLKNHMKSHGISTSPSTKSPKKGAKKVWCDICHCAFENTASLERHKSEDHADDGMPALSDDQSEVDLKTPFVFTCDVCVQTFTTKIALKKHKEKHAREVRPVMKNKPLVYCKYCKISFANPFQLTNHMNEEHMEDCKPPPKKEKTKQFVCKICGKNFTTASALYAHQGWHKRGKFESEDKPESPVPRIKEEPKTETHFECRTCNAVLPNDTALQIHILEKHRNVNATVLPARCTMCNLDFNSQDEYDQHKRFHAMVEKQPKAKTWACTQCPAGFSRADMLKMHVKQFHKEVKEYRCHHCDRVFEKGNSLSIHLKVHEKQKLVSGGKASPVPVSKSTKALYSCSICNKGFDLPKDLRMHTIQAHPF
ncbi:zinc finger protein 91 isoform X1 [Tribolium castaneum]|uniref:Zinc finger protein Xfin-like Protein n=1 Tax=Tribolium castaneum TaxID=7070 RepID=D6X1Z6_TRICA|nr:PREDICTED: zinc finger protein 91 isoform X1 [Tribolium castaneum]XP_015838790.1 PREDICTED: zinc finger protein 91 isoform X1 [Tribolium castaneum]EFA10192.1 Zinc finger protein Xfin-like Protein [Tribolium castaneum]|eukprot:XP_015838789.1 PREDICTED: zinc finger protein 91 isoform X1 [Tribolium castaneum]